MVPGQGGIYPPEQSERTSVQPGNRYSGCRGSHLQCWTPTCWFLGYVSVAKFQIGNRSPCWPHLCQATSLALTVGLDQHVGCLSCHLTPCLVGLGWVTDRQGASPGVRGLHGAKHHLVGAQPFSAVPPRCWLVNPTGFLLQLMLIRLQLLVLQPGQMYLIFKWNSRGLWYRLNNRATLNLINSTLICPLTKTCYQSAQFILWLRHNFP